MNPVMERGRPARPKLREMFSRLAMGLAGKMPALRGASVPLAGRAESVRSAERFFRGVSLACVWAGRMPALQLGVGIALLFSASLRAETGMDVSADFTLDTRVTPTSGVDYSGLFIVDTRYGLGNGANVSKLFTIDTRYSGSSGSGESGLFTVDTLNAITPSVTVTGRVTTTNGVGLLAATVQAVINNRVLGSASCDFDGNYALPLLPPGTYELRATRADFVSGVKRGLVFNTGDSRAVNFALAPRPAPATTQPVNRQPPPNLTGPPTPNQLKVWNGTQFVSGLSLSLNRPTVIMTHGYIASPNDWAVNMASRMSDALAVIGTNANLVAWDWSSVSHDLPGLAYSHTPAQGEALGKALADSLPGYARPVHFIGHSLGALVNARAANYLHEKNSASFPPSRTHMTVLDNAVLANFGAPVLDAVLLSGGNGALAAYITTTELAESGGWVSAFPDEAAWMDNYISLVGYPSSKAVNICLAQSAYFANNLFISYVPVLQPMHSYSHEWYRGTVLQPQGSPMGHRYSYERLGDNAGFSASYPYAAGTWLEQSSTVDEYSLRRLSEGEIVICQAKIANATARAASVKFATAVDGVVQTVGNVAAAVVEKTRGIFDSVLSFGESIIDAVPAVYLTTGPAAAFPFAKKSGGGQLGGNPTNTPAYAWFTVAIPSNAALMTFDFKLSGDPGDDCLTFAIEGTNQFALAGRFIPPDVTHHSSYLEVSKWAGTNAEFFFGITGGTSTNATFAVDGIRFYALEKPALSARPAGSQLVLSWPLSASDFVLEASPTLAFSNVWTVVTNVPLVENFQYSLTNSLHGAGGFYRLRKP